MKNPYEEQLPVDTVSIGKPLQWSGLIVFLGLIALLPLFGWKGLFIGGAVDGDLALREELRSFENRFSESGLFEPWRKKDQARLVRWFREGNRKVMIGKDGWLFYRPDIEAVVGKGPFYVEPNSVAREPGLEPWQPPVPVIKDFAEQLEGRDIALVLVPVPTKAMVYGEAPGGGTKAFPKDWERVIENLRNQGVQVVDLMNDVETAAPFFFLKQDTHWTPGIVEAVARKIAGEIRRGESNETPYEKRVLSGRFDAGDLVGMLGVGGADSLFEEQIINLNRVEGVEIGESAASVVLLGDSFVNIYEDPSLGFGNEDEDRIRAGFSSHLAASLGYGIETIASNGGGATVVRKRFAESLQNRKSLPETVVWVLSARDIFLSEIPARRARIKWEFVDLPEVSVVREPEPGEVVVTATLREKSRIGGESEQKSAAYQSAIYSTIFDGIEVVSGEMEGDEAWVFLWAAKKKELVETARLQIGKRYRLKLIPFPKEGEVSTATQLDDFFRLDLSRLFAAEVEEVE